MQHSAEVIVGVVGFRAVGSAAASHQPILMEAGFSRPVGVHPITSNPPKNHIATPATLP